MMNEYLNGQIAISYGKTRLGFKMIEAPAPKRYQPVVPRFKVRGITKPPKQSRFRGFVFGKGFAK